MGSVGKKIVDVIIEVTSQNVCQRELRLVLGCGFLAVVPRLPRDHQDRAPVSNAVEQRLVEHITFPTHCDLDDVWLASGHESKVIDFGVGTTRRHNTNPLR